MGRPMFMSLQEACEMFTQLRHLLEEYDYSKNKKHPSEISSRDVRNRLWWYCKRHDYSWQECANNRVQYPTPPCCSGRAAHKFRNLATEYPDIAKDWDYDSNGLLTPYDVTPASHIRVNWKCHKCEYMWDTLVYSRTQRLGRCPNCSKAHTSKAEIILYRYFKEIFKETTKAKIEDLEFDIVIPEIKVAIEYDGFPWHLEKQEIHNKKLDIAIRNGYILINIAEYKADKLEQVKNQYTPNHRVIYREINSSYTLDNLLPLVREYFKQFGNIVLPEPQYDINEYLSSKQVSSIQDSLWDKLPWLREWIAPQDIEKAKTMSHGSGDKITLHCRNSNCNREWEVRAHHIKQKFNGCSKCKCRLGVPEEQIEKVREYYRKCNSRR